MWAPLWLCVIIRFHQLLNQLIALCAVVNSLWHAEAISKYLLNESAHIPSPVRFQGVQGTCQRSTERAWRSRKPTHPYLLLTDHCPQPDWSWPPSTTSHQRLPPDFPTPNHGIQSTIWNVWPQDWRDGLTSQGCARQAWGPECGFTAPVKSGTEVTLAMGRTGWDWGFLELES